MSFVSCVGFSGAVAVRSRGCSLALLGIAPVCGVTLAKPAGALTVGCKAPAGGGVNLLSARLVPSGAAATPGRRNDVFACRAAGLHGGNYSQSPLDPERLSDPELLDFLAKKTLYTLERVHFPKLEDLVPPEHRSSVLDEIGAIRAGSEELVKELTDPRISFNRASVKLVGLHARIFTLLNFCRVEQIGGSRYTFNVPPNLEAAGRVALLCSMSNTVNYYNELQKQPNKKVHGLSEADKAVEILPELLVILLEKTAVLLDKMPDILLERNGTPSVILGEVMPSSLDLVELQEIRHLLKVNVGAGDHAAVGTLLGLHFLLQYILSEVNKCFYVGKGDSSLLPGTLQSVYNKSLRSSMFEVDRCLMDFLCMPKETE